MSYYTLELLPGSCSGHHTSLSSILNCQYQKKLCFLSASIQFGRYVCFTAGKHYLSCPGRKKKNLNFFLYNQPLGKFDSVLNGKRKCSGFFWNSLLSFLSNISIGTKTVSNFLLHFLWNPSDSGSCKYSGAGVGILKRGCIKYLSTCPSLFPLNWKISCQAMMQSLR